MADNSIRPKVSIIIVSFNSFEHLDTCLSSVLKQTYPNFEVILSDNASTDGTLEYVSAQFPDVILVKNNENLGWANGINAALPLTSGFYIAPLNVDTEVTPGWLTAMVDFLDSHPEVGAVTPKILLFDDRTRINTMGHNVHISGLSFCRKLYQKDYISDIPEKVSGISGCSYLIRRSTLDRMGGLPRDSFMSNDDVIVSWLLHLMGFRIYCITNSVMYHKYQLKMNPAKLYRLEKDRGELILSMLKPLTLVVMSPVFLAVELMIIAYSLVKGKAYSKAKLSDLESLWGKRHVITEKRRQYQRLRVVSDRRLLRSLRSALEWRQLFGIIHSLEATQYKRNRHSLSWRINRPLRLVGSLKRLITLSTLKVALDDLRRGDIKGLLSKTKTVISRLSDSADSGSTVNTKSIDRFDVHSFLDWLGNRRIVSHSIIIDHGLGGGANQYRQRRIQDFNKQGTPVILVYYGLWVSQIRIRYVSSDIQQEWFTGSIEILEKLIDRIQIKEILFNNAYSFPDPELIAHQVAELKKRSGARFTFAVHDFFSICPSYILLDEQFKFCGIPRVERCRTCIPKNRGNHFALAWGKDIDQWRKAWGYCLKQADTILCFSESSRNLMIKAYPYSDINKLEIKPHLVDYIKNRTNVNLNSQLNIGVVGELSEHKGAGIIREIIKLIENRKMPISVTVIGTMQSVPQSKVVHMTGRYKMEDLSRIIEETGANIFFVPSIWPETFCYVAEELMALGVPVAVFNIGAPTERVSKYEKGLIINAIDARSALDALISFYKKLRTDE
jgi:GT2 family glycosyltransferase/glycosyltransferase involved in cell wall biosynthesis